MDPSNCDSLQVWNECVKVAKSKTRSSGRYQIIKGSVLKNAQTAYGAVISTMK